MNPSELEFIRISYPFEQDDEARIYNALARGKLNQDIRRVYLGDKGSQYHADNVASLTPEQQDVIVEVQARLHPGESMLCGDMFGNGMMDVFIVDRSGLYCGVFMYKPQYLPVWPQTVGDAAQMVYGCTFAEMTGEETEEFRRFAGRYISYDLPGIFVLRSAVDRYVFIRGKRQGNPVVAAVDLSAARLWNI